ncbi:hypothetical protein [Lysinibacillus sp. JNUCC 51]|uniref:hypothetical protein n=1 Tax=Lysinibacillus sp. JNUCC-51 TaxID=2792479 RepID=UPI00193847BF|nr:hypothetical protein JNUCC51_19470 [Lysinibacillus sp. JNUCC-51]
MYFPSLNHLSRHGVNATLIDTLDTWLGNLSGRKKRRIRPARFAVDTGVDFNTSNELFSLVMLETGILEINYEVYCPDEETVLVGIFGNIDDIPELIKCEDCGQVFDPFEYQEFIKISFDLIVSPDPDSPKYIKLKITPKSFNKLKPVARKSKSVSNYSYKDMQVNAPLYREEIDRALFRPNWNEYDKHYQRFLDSTAKGISTEEKGKALEELSCLLLSFITFFKVDSTISTVTNQLDVTISIKPYLKDIEIPLLRVINNRLIGECKNEDGNMPSKWVDKLAAVIDKMDNTKSGILFSNKKFSGDDYKFARASQLEHARLKKYIININTDDFKFIHENKVNLYYFLSEKFEELEMRISRKGS